MLQVTWWAAAVGCFTLGLFGIPYFVLSIATSGKPPKWIAWSRPLAVPLKWAAYCAKRAKGE